MRVFRRYSLCVVACAAVLLPVLAVDVPSASAAAVHPTDGKIVAVTAHTVTVQVPATPGAARYVVSASTDRKQMTVDALRSDKHNVHHYRASSTSPTVTVDVGHFTRTPFYYRVAAIQASNGYDAWADTYASPFGLRPAAPTALKRHSGADGAYLAWKSGSSNGASIEQATNRTFTAGRKSYRISGITTRFTPYGLTRGRTYWFRVRAVNVHTYSTPSAAVSLVAKAREQKVRVMSYNLLSADQDGRHEGGHAVAPWPKRVKVAAKLVKRAEPDVLAVQEAFPILGASRSQYPSQGKYYPGWKIPARNPCNNLHYANKARYPYRQVDSLCDALGHGKAYRRALDTDAHHSGYGDYFIYNHNTTSLVGHGGYWHLGNNRSAAWQVFRTHAGKVNYLVVSPHTIASLGSKYTKQRAAEMRSMVAQAKHKAAARGITRIIYAGDFNTYPGRHGVADPTSPIMRGYGYADAVQQAQALSNAKYNSANFYATHPPTGNGSIDHIFTTRGIGVQRFGEVLNLAHGKWVGTIPSDHNPIYADLTLPH